MKSLVFLCLVLVLPLSAQQAMNGGSPWENSIVTIEIARKQYNYNQPWSRETRRLKKSGIVVEKNQVLTTADRLADQTLIRLQKQGRGQWYIGQVAWVDYPANLALINVEDTNFWKGLLPAKIDGALPQNGAMQIARWREGNLEMRRAEFNQFTVKESQLAPVSYVVLEAGSDIQGVGWGEPVVSDSRVLGLVASQDGRNCAAITASFINSVLKAQSANAFRGLGYFHFYWQPAANPASLAALGLKGEPRGVIVHFVPRRPDDKPQVIKTNDIILSIDGFSLDVEGDYKDPEFGYVNLENLGTRHRWAGDEVKMKIVREGQEMEISYTLPAYKYTNPLLAFATPDHEPQYLVVGGLVFQPLDNPLLQSWGPEWKRRSPFRLYYFNQQLPTEERPSYVILTQVLPDPFNIGYQDLRYLVLESVNGAKVTNMAELKAALAKPTEGFHVFEFMKTDGLRRLVTAAGDIEAAATDRVLKRYGITQPFYLQASTD